MRNYYTILGIADFAGADEVKAAHRRLSKRYHPDLNNGNQHFEEKFKEVQHAYERLRDPVKKEMYDNQLRYAYAPKNVYTEPIREQPVYTPYTPVQPEPAGFKWKRSRAAIITAVFFTFIFYRAITAEPPKPDYIHSRSFIMYDSSLLNTPSFNIASDREIVLEILGKPLSITRDGESEIWHYGNSFVIVNNGEVSSNNNIDSNLHIRD